jgi:hypothetical protein
MEKSMVSCRFSLKAIHCMVDLLFCGQGTFGWSRVSEASPATFEDRRQAPEQVEEGPGFEPGDC